jgi:hypothetical protein
MKSTNNRDELTPHEAWLLHRIVCLEHERSCYAVWDSAGEGALDPEAVRYQAAVEVLVGKVERLLVGAGFLRVVGAKYPPIRDDGVRGPGQPFD